MPRGTRRKKTVSTLGNGEKRTVPEELKRGTKNGGWV